MTTSGGYDEIVRKLAAFMHVQKLDADGVYGRVVIHVRRQARSLRPPAGPKQQTETNMAATFLTV